MFDDLTLFHSQFLTPVPWSAQHPLLHHSAPRRLTCVTTPWRGQRRSGPITITTTTDVTTAETATRSRGHWTGRPVDSLPITWVSGHFQCNVTLHYKNVTHPLLPWRGFKNIHSKPSLRGSRVIHETTLERIQIWIQNSEFNFHKKQIEIHLTISGEYDLVKLDAANTPTQNITNTCTINTN